MRTTCALGLGLWALSLVACSQARPLSNAEPSAHALGDAVLRALAARDAVALRGLALSEQEFREHVWPELPAARPERNLPFSYVWGDLRQKSEQALAQTLARVGGQSLSVVSVRFEGETTHYPSYQVHRETLLTVRDAQGQTRQMRVFGSALEKDGEWKVFSYITDED